jgi:threonine synthase
MDIQVSSNFERLYYELKGGDAAGVAQAMTEFRRTGTLPATREEWQAATKMFSAVRVDDEATLAEITATYHKSGTVLDPHSAIAVAAAKAKRHDPSVPMIALATAHPAKFADAVERAIGQKPTLPPSLAVLMQLPERKPELPHDLGAVQNYIRAHARAQSVGASL